MTDPRQPTDFTDPAATLRRYLHEARQALWWKLDGLSEREVRLPRTPTGTNLLGIVKHCLHVEAGYFGPTFGRDWPAPDELVPFARFETEPQADWYATEDETAAGLVDLHRRIGEFADETIASHGLDARGRVPWWPADRAEVTLHRIAVHVLGDLARHAGHADILREQVDGAVGLLEDNTNIPDETHWDAYTARLTALAHRFP